LRAGVGWGVEELGRLTSGRYEHLQREQMTWEDRIHLLREDKKQMATHEQQVANFRSIPVLVESILLAFKPISFLTYTKSYR